MFGFIKKIFNGLRPNEYTQGLHYYPFAIKLDRCVGGCNTLNDLTGINESKTLTKHVSCECKCKFDCRKCNSNQKWNNGKCRCECKNIICVKKITFGIVLHVVAKMANI